ncbi:MAG: DUF1294 domain-containing protein [Polyangiaceae bacterium]
MPSLPTMPLPVAAGLALYAVMGLVTFGAFGLDKARAKEGARRVPERTLLLLSLAFGVVGGALGMRVFRHKTRKASFFVPMIGCALVHAAAVGYALTRLAR